ncbi:MAG: hypothetical protein AB7P37_13625 [Ramlibacter sp.]
MLHTAMTPFEFQLHFRCLSPSGADFAFPCDCQGRVDMDGLSERVRNDYLFARAMVGRDLAAPAVEPTDLQPLAA